jgi:ribose 5-phosphate isomerase B
MIAIACDHGGYALKETVKQHLKDKGYEVKDFGTNSLDSCDYPDYAAPAAQAVASGECEKGIVICTTGIGVSIVANKVKGVRCALCADTLSASLTRRHNDTNMLAMGAGIIGQNLALEIVDTWLTTEFEGGRHQRRVDKITALEG